MKHTTEVKGYSGSHEQLAEDIGDLFYDSLATFLHTLASKIENDAVKDRARGRVRLAKELSASARHIDEAAKHIAAAWVICEPFARK